tara:strand:+ start:2239 stop:2535 length:297 start_codon:yes stop_codon:yes gene_type:complete
MKTIESQISEVDNKLNILLSKLESIEANTNKMSLHIDFIESVYRTVAAPMYWICNRINSFRSDEMYEIRHAPKSIDTIEYRIIDEMNKNKYVNIFDQD